MGSAQLNSLLDEVATLTAEYVPGQDVIQDTRIGLVQHAIREYNLSIEMLETIIANVKDRYNQIVMHDLPLLFEEMGVNSVTLANGKSAKLETVWSVSTKDRDRGLLAEWLESHELGGLIKDSLLFEKGDVDEALVTELREKGKQFSRSSDVNAAALKAALKRHMEDGGDLPPEEAVAVSIFPRVNVK